MALENGLEPASFRDKNNRVFYQDGKVYRSLSQEAFQEWKRLTATAFYARLVRDHKIIATHVAQIPPPPIAAGSAPWVAVLQHETIPFISYPYEWSFGMLKDAALLQLDLMQQALAENMTLKDATPYNIQWIGSRPVFIDIPSFVPWEPGSPWVAYGQFCRLFLYPLMLQSMRGIAFQPWLRGAVDGIPLDQMRRVLSLRDYVRPGVFTNVLLHAHLHERYGSTSQNIRQDLKHGGFSKDLIQANVRNLQNLVSRLSWGVGGSEWSDYAQQRNYSAQDYEAKKAFVRDVVGWKKRNLVWDLGCNTGDFSRIAAEGSGYVVSMDSDAWVVEMVYRGLQGNNAILPLAMNLADASPNLGWQGRERKSISSRSHPELILSLALIHHLAITANLPLLEIIQWLAGFHADLVIEFIGLDDEMVKRLLRNKEGRHDDYQKEYFEKHLADAFRIRKTLALSGGTRFLYACEAK